MKNDISKNTKRRKSNKVSPERAKIISEIENSGNENIIEISDNDETVHTSIDPNTSTIAIIDDIINNKPYQIVIDRTPHNKSTCEDHKF